MSNFPNSQGRKFVLTQVQTVINNQAYLSEVDGKIGFRDFNELLFAYAQVPAQPTSAYYFE
jgi:hypothetical protein